MEARVLALGLVIGLVIGFLAAINPIIIPHKTITTTTTLVMTKELTKSLVKTVTTTSVSTATKLLTTTVTTSKLRTVTVTTTSITTVTPKEFYRLKEEVRRLKEVNTELIRQCKNLTIKVSRLNAEVAKLSEIKEFLTKKLNEYIAFIHRVHDEAASRTGDYILAHPEALKTLCDWGSSEVKSALVEAVSSWSLLPKDALTKIFDWVANHVKYSFDSPLYVPPEAPGGSGAWVDDYWRKASETIRDGHGDCEDQALLLAAMVYAYSKMSGSKVYPLLVWLQLKDYQHVITVVLYGEGKVALLDPTAKYLTGIDLLIWHQIEPKNAKQAVNDYLNALQEVGEPAQKAIAILDPIKGKVLKENIPLNMLGPILESYSKEIIKT